MKVKDIVKHAAVYLGLEKAVRYIENGEFATDGNALSEVDHLTRCANLVINELACSYLPVVKRESVNGAGCRIDFSSLTETPLKVIGVEGENGDSVIFETFPDYVKTYAQAAYITYEYIPSNSGLNDDIGYAEKDVPSRVIAYGVAAEYSLIVKAFSESVEWRERFADEITKLSGFKTGVIKRRAFI